MDVYRIAYSCGVMHYESEQNPSLDDLTAEGDELMYARKQARPD